MSTSDDDIRQAPPAPWARGMGNFMGNWLWLKEPSFGDDCSSDDEAEQYRDPWNYVPLAKTSGRKRAPSTMSERPAKGRKRAEEVNGGGAHGPESDDDCDELEGEVLKDEDMFARFTSEIVSGREFPSGEFDSVKPEDDPEYELPPPNHDPDTNGEQESDSSDGGAPSTMSERPKMQKARKQKPLTRTKSRQERGNQEE